jgi:type I restriction enzyme S subunit
MESGAICERFPSRLHGKRIAAFLDRETAKIDGLVGEQRRLIELLKEKRQAVISHAVTKGLNPHAPMKPSGIEWLGDVPEHWETRTIPRSRGSRKSRTAERGPTKGICRSRGRARNRTPC